MESEGLTLAVDAADTGQGGSTSECGDSSCEQTAQEILPVNIIVQGEMFHQPGRILSEESQGSVESDRLSTLDPLIHNDVPASAPQNHQVYLWEPGEPGRVSFEEAIRRLNESEPEDLMFEFQKVDGCDEAYKEHRHQFIDAVSTCQSLKNLTIEAYDQKLKIEEVQRLCQNLPPALNSLTLNGLFDYDVVQIVCEMMANNCVLKNLSLGIRAEGRMSSAGASLGSMLAINSTLDSLDVRYADLGPNGVEALLQPLTGHATARPLNKSLARLLIGGHDIPMGQGAGEAIAHMLRTNDTLTHFSMEFGIGLEPSDVCKILESLQKNQTLLSLDLYGCQGVNGPDVSAKIMDLFQMNRSLTRIDLGHTPLEQSDVCKILESLQKNQGLRYLGLADCKAVKGPDVLAKMMDLVRMHPCLMEIVLWGTPLEREGQAAQVQAQLENNAKDYMAVLRGMPRVPPKFVRVFLCGNAYSGKTTLGRSMKRAFASGCGPNLFLPLMEVVLKRHFTNLKLGAICENEKNLMKICVNGLEIFVELSGNEMPGHAFIDILVKSSKSEIQTIQLVHDHVLSPIEHFCSSPQGCQGVTLMRGVLRPKAVKKLLLCKNRTKQVAWVENLKKQLLATNLDLELVHPWPQVDVQGNDFLHTSMEDKVSSLLGEVATHDVLERHLEGLKDVEIDINNLPSSEQESEHTQGETSESGVLRLQRSFHRMSLQEPTNLEQLIRDIMRAELRSSEERIVARISTKLEEVFEKTKQEIKCMEEWLYTKLSKKLDGMTKLLLQLHQQQVPCNAFFTTGGTKQQRRLVDIDMWMGIGVVYLHFLCEDIDGIHVVDDQKGVEIRYVEDENRHKIAHLVIVGFKIVLILSKVAAHVVAGVGNLVPNFAQGLALAYDAQDITDCIADPKIHGGPILGQSGTSHLPTARNALVEDHKVATQWLVDFLRGKNIFNLFGLSRVRYLKMDSSHGDFSTIRWVCLHHRKEGLENGTLEDCPA
ncbi:unnamed protein product [Sphagnum balticum]